MATLAAPTTGTTPRPAPLPGARAPARLRVRAALWQLRFLCAALLLGAAAGVVVHALRPPAPVTVPVLTLAHDVPAGTVLTAGDLVVSALPPAAAPVGALRNAAAAEGRSTAVDLPARAPLVAAMLVDATLAGPAGTVVVAVRLDDPAVGALLEPGVRLDLVAARHEGGPGETVARRALVRPAPPGTDLGDGLLGGGATDVGPPVLVAVTPDEAVRIAETSLSARLVAVVVP